MKFTQAVISFLNPKFEYNKTKNSIDANLKLLNSSIVAGFILDHNRDSDARYCDAEINIKFAINF